MYCMCNYSLPKEACALVGHRYSVLGVYIELILHSTQLLLKLVDVGHLHAVRQGKSLKNTTVLWCYRAGGGKCQND